MNILKNVVYHNGRLIYCASKILANYIAFYFVDTIAYRQRCQRLSN